MLFKEPIFFNVDCIFKKAFDSCFGWFPAFVCTDRYSKPVHYLLIYFTRKYPLSLEK